MGFLLRRCSRKGPHLVMTGEPCGFSRVTAVFSSFDGELKEPLDLAHGSLITIRVTRGSRGLFLSYCRANRPHLGMCPEIPCSFPVVTGISRLHSRFSRGVRPLSTGSKNSALLSCCNGYVLEPIEWPKGSQASCGVWREDSGLLSRPCRKRRASSRDDGGISCFFFFFELQWDLWVSLE